MDREKFIAQLNVEEEDTDRQRIMDAVKKSIESNLRDGNARGHRNLIIAMEELSELSRELSKRLRGKGDPYRILEELADVQLAIYYVQEICGISDGELNKAINVKTRRLEESQDKRGNR